MENVACDTLIFGGGAAGLWLLDEMARRGHPSLLLETAALGAGQTIAAQGILHSGLKYTLNGLLNPAAREARDMPAVWRECLQGKRQPDLGGVRLRSKNCYLWRTDSISSRLGMFGACIGLREQPELVAPEQLPPVFGNCPGPIARVAEPVLSPQSLLDVLSRKNAAHILKIDAEQGLEFEISQPGVVRSVVVRSLAGERSVRINVSRVVLAAGAGNAALRERLGLSAAAMQRRPLHMVLVRGNLPACFGHCVDGRATRITITSDCDNAGRTVWQLGGQLAEAGVRLEPGPLVEHARSELQAVLPGVDLRGAEWATYRIDRAEGAVAGGARPDAVRCLTEGNTTTVWPTKLVLAPQLARLIGARTASTADTNSPSRNHFAELADWPRPGVAEPPWERIANWMTFDPPAQGQAAA